LRIMWENILLFRDSSGPIIGMRNRKTDLCCPSSQGKCPLWRAMRIWTVSRQTAFFWTAISVKHRYTERLRLEGRLRTFCWPSTDRTGNQTIFHVSAGDVTQGLPPRLKSARMYIFSDGYRAGNI